jgi:hypothetical protein
MQHDTLSAEDILKKAHAVGQYYGFRAVRDTRSSQSRRSEEG